MRASGPVVGQIRPAWRVPISREKDGPSEVGPMSADGRLSLHVLERLQPRAPLPGERESEAPLTGIQNGRRRGCMLFRRSSDEHTSELQSLTRTAYAGVCLKKKHKYSDLMHPGAYI